jgi:hypothetical protein
MERYLLVWIVQILKLSFKSGGQKKKKKTECEQTCRTLNEIIPLSSSKWKWSCQNSIHLQEDRCEKLEHSFEIHERNAKC